MSFFYLSLCTFCLLILPRTYVSFTHRRYLLTSLFERLSTQSLSLITGGYPPTTFYLGDFLVYLGRSAFLSTTGPGLPSYSRRTRSSSFFGPPTSSLRRPLDPPLLLRLFLVLYTMYVQENTRVFFVRLILSPDPSQRQYRHHHPKIPLCLSY